MRSQILKFYALFIINAISIEARGRIPIAKLQNNNTQITSTTTSINLPRDFKPQISPVNPLLYPFVTEQPGINRPTLGWKPVATSTNPISSVATSTNPISIPTLQDRIGTSTESLQKFQPVERPFRESIVYGTWKPEPPVQPVLPQTETTNDRTEILPTLKNIIRGQFGGFIEEVDRKSPSKEQTDRSASIESTEHTRVTQTQPNNKKHGRRKIGTSFETKTHATESRYVNSMKVVNVNITDPELMKLAKQINESAELAWRTKSTTTPGEVMKTLQQNEHRMSKEWPTDFIDSSENIRFQDNNAQNTFVNFLGDSSEPPLGELSFDDTLLPPTTINITKMGVPYEDQNSGEEPSICVPLTVREQSVSNPLEIIEVERIYCFPLPPPDVKLENGNDTLLFDKDAHYRVLSYEELTTSTTSKGTRCKNIIWTLSILGLLLN